VPATNVNVSSGGKLTATSPAGTVGTVDVTVTTPGGPSATSAADQFTYGAQPTVTSVSPNAGKLAGGTSVTISGANFTSGATVRFGTTAATAVHFVNPSTLTATSPAGSAGSVDVTVTTPGGTSGTSSADLFTYLATPTVTGVSPSSGPIAGGNVVTITGTSFATPASVSFGTVASPNVQVVNATTIKATAPAGSAGTLNITVTTPGGTSAAVAADHYTYT
jgi:hypothetical protein